MAWCPHHYLKFRADRLRPAVDLLNKSVGSFSDPLSVKRVLDLGCGPGNITELLCDFFPNAVVEGVDSSVEMIDTAWKVNKALDSCKDRVNFKVGTIEDEVKRSLTTNKYDLVYSNASLHWCLNHRILVPQILTNLLNPGGVLAVQMPDTREQASHVLMETAALRCGFLDTIKSIRIPRVNHDPSWYFHLLSGQCAHVDMWTTEYIQQLPTAAVPAVEYDESQLAQSSRHPVLEYTRSTGLLPILQVLGGEQDPRCRRYLREYERLLIEEYPAMRLPACGPGRDQDQLVTLMPFKRFFFVCTL